MSLNS